MEAPLISIITVNLNDLQGLKKTVQSVFDQTYKNYELIIIDGGSSDGSKEHIESCDRRLHYWVSEPDDGIYNAMNKGIDHAGGDYLLFLNSGDYLVDKAVLQSFINHHPIEDIIYGNSLIESRGNLCVKKMPVIRNIGKSLTNTINHQTIFFKKSLFEDGSRYNCDYKIVADWVFLNEAMIKKKIQTRHINVTVSFFNLDGISSDKEARGRERNIFINTRFDDDFRALFRNFTELDQEFTRFKNVPIIKLLFKIKRLYSFLGI